MALLSCAARLLIDANGRVSVKLSSDESQTEDCVGEVISGWSVVVRVLSA
jgi:hypothetical protein